MPELPNHRALAHHLQIDELRWLTLLGAIGWPRPSLLDRLVAEHLAGKGLRRHGVLSARLQPDTAFSSRAQMRQLAHLHPEQVELPVSIRFRSFKSLVSLRLDGRVLFANGDPFVRGTAGRHRGRGRLEPFAAQLADAIRSHPVGVPGLLAEHDARTAVAKLQTHWTADRSRERVRSLLIALDTYRGIGGTLAALAEDWAGTWEDLLDTAEAFGADLSPTPTAP